MREAMCAIALAPSVSVRRAAADHQGPALRLPYRLGGLDREAGKANASLVRIVPIMTVLMMVVIILQVRQLSAMAIVLLTAPLGLIGVVPTLLVLA